MLSRPPNDSETGLPYGVDQSNRHLPALGEARHRPLNASFNRENNPCCPGWNCP